MNAIQLKYMRERAKRIFEQRNSNIRDKYREQPVNLDLRLDALREGKFTVAKRAENEAAYGIERYILYSDFPKWDPKAQKTAQDALQREYNGLMDELVLGDNEEALALLKAFEQGL